MNKDELKIYSRGYYAGLKASGQNREIISTADMQQIRVAEDNELKVRLFCSILNGLLSAENNWSLGDKPVNNLELYSKLAQTGVQTAFEKLKKVLL